MQSTSIHSPHGQAAVAVMFAVTAPWTVCLAVTLHSLCAHANPDRSYEIWIVHDGLTGENIQELRKAVAAYPHVLLHFNASLPWHMHVCWPPAFCPLTTE